MELRYREKILQILKFNVMLVLILSQLTNWDYFPPEKDLETNDQHAQDGKKTALRQKKVLEKEIVECLEK